MTADELDADWETDEDAARWPPPAEPESRHDAANCIICISRRAAREATR